jgi:hypothetical protein
MAEVTATLEAVIISEPRKGQIVRLPLAGVEGDRELTPQEAAAFDQVQAALEEAIGEARATVAEVEALVADIRQARKEASHGTV